MTMIEELGPTETLAAAEANLAERCAAEARMLRVAAHGADLSSPDALPEPTDKSEERWRRATGRHGVRLGGEGTPEVRHDQPAELGLVLETTSFGAKHLIADALDLRHRLPRLWADVHAGGVRAWKARKVAAATRHLPLEVMAEVDAALAGLIRGLAWSRFEAILDATIARADPSGAQQAEAATRRFVAVGRANEHHIKTLIARGDTLDIVSFMAAVNRIADILQLEGDTDLVDIRRSKALGILARPNHTLALLTRHQADEETGEPAAPAQQAEQGTGDTTSDEEDAEPEAEDDLGSRSLDLTGNGHVCPSKPPRINLYVHLTQAALLGIDPAAVCRVEGLGPVTARTVRDWLGRTDVSVVVRPVAIPGDAIPVDGYEIPFRIREAVRLRNPATAFPYGSSTSRSLQLDHSIPYWPMDKGGPRGQTGPHGLGPFAQPEHNLKTHSGWQIRQPAPGIYLWRSPHGWIHLVTNTGTHKLGTTPTAHAIWRAATPRNGTKDKARDSRIRSQRWELAWVGS